MSSKTAKDALCLLIKYFSRYCRLTGAATENFSINEQIPRISLLSVQSYLCVTELQIYLEEGGAILGESISQQAGMCCRNLQNPFSRIYITFSQYIDSPFY